MLKVRFREPRYKELFLGLSHSLDYKSLVFAEEEKTATCSTGLACFEGVAPVDYRT